MSATVQVTHPIEYSSGTGRREIGGGIDGPGDPESEQNMQEVFGFLEEHL